MLGYYGGVAYQTGAATSWPAYKALVRAADAHARVAETAFALSLITGAADAHGSGAAGDLAALETVRRSRGLTTHHDSVPGTMRTNVSSNASFYIGNDDVRSDYEAHLYAAIGNATDVAARALAAMAAGGGAGPPLAPLNHVIGGTECVLVYNPLAWARAQAVWVPVATGDVVVSAAAGAVVPSQVSLRGDGGPAVAFIAHVPPMGFAVYEVAVGAGRGGGVRGGGAAGTRTRVLRWGRASRTL